MLIARCADDKLPPWDGLLAQWDPAGGKKMLINDSQGGCHGDKVKMTVSSLIARFLIVVTPEARPGNYWDFLTGPPIYLGTWIPV